MREKNKIKIWYYYIYYINIYDKWMKWLKSELNSVLYYQCWLSLSIIYLFIYLSIYLWLNRLALSLLVIAVHEELIWLQYYCIFLYIDISLFLFLFTISLLTYIFFVIFKKVINFIYKLFITVIHEETFYDKHFFKLDMTFKVT